MSALQERSNISMMPYTLGILLLVFWLSVVRSDDRGVYYDTFPRNWQDSSRNCQQLGAWENTDFSIEGFRVPARPSGFPRDQFFWIGADVHQTPWFTLLGCFETNDADEAIELKKIAHHGKPTFDCYAYCASYDDVTTIGISKVACYCYTDVEKHRKAKEQCEYETFPEYPGELFGGPNGGSVVVYKYNTHSPATYTHDFGNCAGVRYLGTFPIPHQFSSCLNRIGYICANGQVSTAEVTWTEAVKRCGTLKTDVIGHYTDLTDSVKYRPLWTGFYRQSYEYWSPPGENVGNNPERKHCIAVKVNEDGTLYPVTYPQICSKTLPSLCERSTKVDGGWTDWSEWSECNNENGEWKRSKTRTCTNPLPQHGGKDCEGEEMIEESCIPPTPAPSPLDGGWTDWSEWSECNNEKGGWKRSKTRTCTNPSPQHGGKDCEGEEMIEESCIPPTPAPSPLDGGWSDWSAWSECYFVNGMDKKSKTRTCTNPSPQHGGKDCEGDDKIERPCISPQFAPGKSTPRWLRRGNYRLRTRTTFNKRKQ
ncbi:uncharacterized protein LOC134252872 isoform X2 [Saccostrea cucullata]|uniref:uncharacterized protein LOC134252872 isoform X2 n=1 Tax=Saccostrea cuccullata TaxID=36930 RepID=UPI002ED2386B